MADDKFEWDLSDSQRQAEYVLDEVIEGENKEDIEEVASQVAVEHELKKGQMVEHHQIGRNLPRLLYVSNNLDYLEEGSAARSFLESISDQFSEIHLVVSVPLKIQKREFKRLGQNIWLYTTGHIYWWRMPFKLLDLVKDQLLFNDGFRPDLIVADNPYESGYGAYRIARKFKRPFQLHVKEQFWTAGFLKRDKKSRWRKMLAEYLLDHVRSVRAETNDIEMYLSTNHPKISDLAVLPRHFDMNQLIAKTKGIENKSTQFSQYSFVILFVGDLDHKSTLFRAIDAARGLLLNSSVAMVVVGEGKARSEFVERTKILGIEKQVIFRSDIDRVPEYLVSSDAIIITDTNEKSDDLVIQAAAAGLPMVVAKTDFRNDLLTDGEDSFLCDPIDTVEFSQKLTKLLNTPNLRIQFSNTTKLMVGQRFHQDPDSYKMAYANSLINAFGADSA